jgi:D-alanine-D-alanine ligase-like ATP-grasp enzyme
LKNKYCPYCWPVKRRTHLFTQAEYYINKFFKFYFIFFEYLFKKLRLNVWFFEYYFFRILLFFKILNLVENPDYNKIRNRALIFFKEAKKRKLKVFLISFFGIYLNEFCLFYNNKVYFYQEIPLLIFKEDNLDIINDKYKCKKFLKKYNIPVIRGEEFKNKKKALNYGKKTGFPLVVKPFKGSLSHHVTCNIKTKKELLKAINIAKIYQPVFIVEKYLQGELFRVSVVGKKKIFVSKKELANVVGDSFSSIQELINLKNSNINKGLVNQKNYTLHKIEIDDNLLEKLKKQNLSLESVLKKGQKVYLKDKYVLTEACEVFNYTNKIHNKNKELFLKLSKVLDTNLAGIDFICQDISKPYYEQNSAVLEVNSLPYLDMHQIPSEGKGDEVAKIVWEIVLDKLNKK